MLTKLLHAFGSPARQEAVARTDRDGQHRPTVEIQGEACTQLIERYPMDRVPSNGGVNATVVVTLQLDTLLGGLRAASLDTGGRISAGRPDASPAGRASSQLCSAPTRRCSTSTAGFAGTPDSSAWP
jgi:hypothetical protein